MRTVTAIATELADAARDLEAHKEYRAVIEQQLADVNERIGAARARCMELKTELEAPLAEATK